MTRRLGVMGGTFDPPHLGHLAAASEAHFLLDLDEVVLVPAGDPWQKAAVPAASRADRLEMTRLAVQGDPRFSVSSLEVDRPGPTYTVDTLLALRAEHGEEVELVLLLGADALAGLPTWHQAERIADLAQVVGFSRPGHELADPGLPGTPVRLIQVPGLFVSSTDCRERFASNQPTKYLVQDSIAQLIAARGLYRGAR